MIRNGNLFLLCALVSGALFVGCAARTATRVVQQAPGECRIPKPPQDRPDQERAHAFGRWLPEGAIESTEEADTEKPPSGTPVAPEGV